ncbi:MAG TPA: VWA domain-containing protein [Chthoniobacteraceae bacterium]|jgi:Ca-activated chloride channel family protein
MSFGQPQWFWAFALLPIVVGLFLRNEVQRGKLLRGLVAARLQDRLVGTVSPGKRRLRFALLLLGVSCLIVSLAQPRLGYTWEQSKRKGRDVLIAIDVSKSMLANDLKPDRLTRAKLAAQDLIAQSQGDRVGLVAFAGSAFLQAPLTVDFGAVMDSLKELDTEIIPQGGSNLAEALKVSVEAFGKGESDHRALIIFSDGEELDADGLKVAAKLNGAVRIFTVGIGSPEGSLLPVPGASGGTEFVKDARGQFVKSRLDADRLRKIAEATGGFYVHLQSGLAEMTQIVRDGLGNMTEKDIDAKMSRQPIERYQWPLAAGLLLLASSMFVSERRRLRAGSRKLVALAVLLAGVGTMQAAPSPRELYGEGRFAEAQKGFEEALKQNPDSEILAFNLGAAAYKNQDLDTALKAFSQALTTEEAELRAKAEYNLGNTLFQKGSPKMEEKTLRDALAHYEQALKLAPADENTRHNKKVTEDLLAKLKQEQQKKKEEEKKEKDDKKENQKDPKDAQQGEKKEKSKQPGEQKKEEGSDGSEKKEESNSSGGEKPEEKSGEPKNLEKDGEGKPSEEKKDGEKGDGEKDAAPEQAKDESQSKDGKAKPVPSGEAGKREGELKANSGAPEENDPQQEAEAEEAAAAQGKMTPRQAKELLDSLKNQDERVQLVDPAERKRSSRVLRDW